jgi:hypothetical protein
MPDSVSARSWKEAMKRAFGISPIPGSPVFGEISKRLVSVCMSGCFSTKSEAHRPPTVAGLDVSGMRRITGCLSGGGYDE